MKSQADYGIDAPHVIRNFSILGGLAIILGFISNSQFQFRWHDSLGSALIWWGAFTLATSLFMVLYSTVGKLKHRDRILNRISWKGDEHVLDVGTGRGLLMIGAAKYLSSGKSVGIDIWNAEDLSNNQIENTLRNAELEGVRDKVQVFSEDARNISFPNASFDVIVSNLCLHNIYSVEGRRQACQELARILKPGGKIIISDMAHTAEYQKTFVDSGLKTQVSQPLFLSTFPPLRIVEATKNL